jgi:hypothetical protein
MTVSSTSNKHIYSGNGVTIYWPYTFSIILAADIKVYLTDTSGTVTELTTDFDVDTLNSRIVYPGSGSGQPILPTGWKITVLREEDLTQELDLTRSGPLDSEALETAYDKLTMITQQLGEELDRCIKYGVEQNPTSTETETFLSAIELAKTQAQAAAAAASVSETNAGVSEANAAASELAAGISESNASTSEANAASSANTASIHAGTATTQAGIATTQAGIATSAASTATTQAGLAQASANAAANSESNAAISESNALSSANDAALSEAAAQSSEDDAETAQLAAEAALSSVQALIDASLRVVDFCDTPIIDLSSTPIPASSSNSLEIVSALASDVKKIVTVEDIGEFIGLYTGPVATPTLQCVLPLGGGSVELQLPVGAKVSIRHMQNTAINSGFFEANFLGL